MDILIKNMEMPSCCGNCRFSRFHEANPWTTWYTCLFSNKNIDDTGNGRLVDCPLIPVPEHNDLADKAVIIERMGEVYEALYDKVDEKALSECHVAFLKAVMYAPTVIPSTDSAVVLERTT